MAKKGEKLSEETKRKISESRKGQTSSFKDKKHSKESIEKNRKAHLGKKMSKENIQKLKERNKGNKYALGYKHTEDELHRCGSGGRGKKQPQWVIKKRTKSLKGKKRNNPVWNKGLTKYDDERIAKYGEKIQQKVIERIMSGKAIRNSRKGFRKDLKEYGYIASALEANTLRYLKHKKYKIEYQIPIYLSDGSIYHCDFYIENTKQFIETKGYLTKYNITKYKQLKNDYPRMNWELLMMTSDKWKKINKYGEKNIKYWEKY